MEGPSQEAAARVARVMGRSPVRWERNLRGYGPTERWVGGFAGGTSAFVKVATTEITRDALRAEAHVLEHIRAPFTPVVLGWEDDHAAPMIVLEDLSGAEWPPPWGDGTVARVVATLADLARKPAPPGVPSLEDYRVRLTGWVHVAEDPGPFLGLGFATAGWLERALPVLREAEAAAPLGGDALCHFDVRSDNICFAGARTVLVDWNFTALGNPKADLAAWVPSLRAEGGPAPDEMLPGEPELAALVAGYFSWKAGLPPDSFPRARRVRDVQRQQLTAALPWAARALGLQPLDGPRAHELV